ncbi:MAG: segregation/condensation protein A [Sphaerochaetaceae bacterium]
MVKEVAAPLSYTLDKFEGPLDLLLHLVQKAKVNIYDIPIGEITDQFLVYLNSVEELGLDDLSEFYQMAAHLIYMKSRMLLPNFDSLEDDEEFTRLRGELVDSLLEYQKYRRYSVLLESSREEGELFISRKKSQFSLPFEDEELFKETNVWDLFHAFAKMLRSITPQQVFNVYEEVTIKQKITLMSELFEGHQTIKFVDLIVNFDSPLDLICAFLAVLDAVKYALIEIYQEELFGEILLKKRGEFESELLKIIEEENP